MLQNLENQNKEKKGFFKRLFDKLDKKLEEKSKQSSCCCNSKKKSEDKDKCC